MRGDRVQGTVKNFVPVVRMTESFQMLVVNADSPWKTLKAFVDICHLYGLGVIVDVVAYDLGSDSWETLADYPAAVAFPSFGASMSISASSVLSRNSTGRNVNRLRPPNAVLS